MTTQFFSIAHVSRDGRDLVISTIDKRVLFIWDFERICHGETSLLDAGQVLLLLRGYDVHDVAFEHGRVCVATVRVLSLFIFTLHRLMPHPLCFPLSLAFLL